MKRWPLKKAHLWETAPFFRILLPFAAGILCYDRGWIPQLPSSYFVWVICVSFLLYLSLAYIKKSNTTVRAIAFSVLCIVLFFSGISVSYFSDVRNNKAWFGNSLNNGNSYLARITDVPLEKENSWKVSVSLISTIKGGKVSPVIGKSFLYLYKDHTPMLLHKGDSILVPGKWQLIRNAGNPFEFDYAGYYRRNNIFYAQSCSPDDVRLYAAGSPDGASFIDRSHDWCMAQLDKYITDPKTKGLMQAMILGDEVNLDEDLRQSYSEAGIIYIIAISGGHVAVFFLFISALLWWIRHRKHLWIKYVVALPLIWFYVLMTGGSPSAIRAATMFSLLALSLVLEKNTNSLNQLFASAFLLLCAQPLWLFSAGFHLSFVAVLSLILFYKPIYKWMSPVSKPASWLWGAVSVTIAIEILVAPLTIYYFHIFPLLFIIANIVAYLFMSIVLIMGMLIIALSFMPAVATFLGMVITWLVTVFDCIVMWLQNFNPESFHFIMLTGAELFVVYIIITGFALFLMMKQKPALFTGLVATCLLLCLSCRSEWTRLHQQRLVVYNTAKANHIELINGSTYTVLHTDTTAQNKTSYAVKPAHITWQAWKKDTTAANELFEIGGKTVLLLNNDISTDDRFPVDYLVINYTSDMDLAKLQRIFSPSLIIINNNYSQKEQEEMVKEGAGVGIAIHAVANEGAFVLK